jgi:hypothetical protein
MDISNRGGVAVAVAEGVGVSTGVFVGLGVYEGLAISARRNGTFGVAVGNPAPCNIEAAVGDAAAVTARASTMRKNSPSKSNK